jgi:hypothetical protein
MKKIITSLLVLFIYVAAKATDEPTLHLSVTPLGAGVNVATATYSLTQEGFILCGSFDSLQDANGKVTVCHNVALFKSNGGVVALDNGISEATLNSCETSTGTLWVISATGLYELGATGWSKVSVTPNANPVIKGITDAGNGNVLLIGSFTSLGTTSCNFIARYNAANKTVDTLGLGDGFPVPTDTNANLTSIAQAGSKAYIMWSTTPNAYVYSYDLATGTLDTVPGIPGVFYGVSLAYSQTTGALYYFCYTNGFSLYKFQNGQWSSNVPTFNQSIYGMNCYNGNVYLSGQFTYVNNQPMNQNAILNESDSTFSQWNVGINDFTMWQVSFFPNGNAIACSGFLYSDFVSTTGISSVTDPKFALYPNPTASTLTLSGLEQGTQIKIYDILGNQVLNTVIEGTTFRIDVSSFPNGAYFVSENGNTAKFIKQ